MVQVNFYDTGTIQHNKLEFAVIVSEFEEQLVLVQHKERDTWEVPGGHKETDENIGDTAARELVEETGARDFNIHAVSDYSVTMNNHTRYGRLFYAKIQSFDNLPDLEIEKIQLFDMLPNNLTYPTIQPHLYENVLLWKKKAVNN